MKKWWFYPLIIVVFLMLVSTILFKIDTQFAQSTAGILTVIYIVILIIVLLVFGFFALRWILRKLFFKVRNRIIANYILTGVLPLCLVFFLIWLGTHLFLVQVVSLQLKQFLEKESSDLQQIAYEVSFLLSKETSETDPSEYEKFVEKHRERFPGLQVSLFYPGQEQILWSSEKHPIPNLDVKESIARTFVVYKDTVYLTVALAGDGRWSDYPMMLAVPLKDNYLEKIEHQFDARMQFFYGYGSSTKDKEGQTTGFKIKLSDPKDPAVKMGKNMASDQEAQAQQWLEQLPSGVEYFSSYMFDGGKIFKNGEPATDVAVLALVHAKYLTMIGKFIQGSLPAEVPAPKILFWLLISVAGFFVFIELVALIISLFLSRSITKVIAQLYKKTRRVSKGDFSFQIRSRRRDQLGELASSTDQMSEDLQKLLLEVKEKERLEQEIAIAQEVQKTFFPKSLPSIQGVALLGKCVPARKVSGDYYDFIRHEEGLMDFFIGDISGKGISAALLMASSQTFLRMESAKRPMQSVPRIINRFNNYLVDYSSQGKYSTLFYGRLDKSANTLTYCNAGHNPPFLLRGGQVVRLSAGGMIPGILPDEEYVEETVALENHDLMVAFTDGFTEVFNRDDEEFGEDRLSELVKSSHITKLPELYESLVDSVQDWSSSTDQTDDMTMLMFLIA